MTIKNAILLTAILLLAAAAGLLLLSIKRIKTKPPDAKINALHIFFIIMTSIFTAIEIFFAIISADIRTWAGNSYKETHTIIEYFRDKNIYSTQIPADYPYVLIFTSQTCDECNNISEKLTDYLKNKKDWYYINKDNTELATKYNVSDVPSAVLVTSETNSRTIYLIDYEASGEETKRILKTDMLDDFFDTVKELQEQKERENSYG